MTLSALCNYNPDGMMREELCLDFSVNELFLLTLNLDEKLISSPHQALSSENPEAIGLQGTAWQSSMANKETPNNVGGLARGTVIYPVRFPHEARMLFPIFEVFGSVLLRLSSAVVVVISKLLGANFSLLKVYTYHQSS